MPTIPPLIAEKLTELQSSRRVSEAFERFNLEKKLFNALHGQVVDDEKNKLIISDKEVFYGQVDEAGKLLQGIMVLKQDLDYTTGKEFVADIEKQQGSYIKNLQNKVAATAIFIGDFVDGRPANGQYKWRDAFLEITSNEKGELQKVTKKSPQTQEWQEEYFVDGKKTQEKFFSDIKEFGSFGERFTDFIEKRIKPITPPADFSQFESTVVKFSQLRAQHQSLYSSTLSNVAPKLQAKLSALDSQLKRELDEGKLPVSSTAILELSGVQDEKQKEFLDKTIKGFNRKRFGENIPDFARDDFVNFPYDGSYGNCLEYAQSAQSKAIESGLTQTFVIWANPNHVFNIAVEDDKMFMIDHWNGDLICEFTPENFFEHANLHGIYELVLNDCNWRDGESKGPLDRSDQATKQAQSVLEARLTEINNARFDPKFQQILFARVSQKISTLDPNDYFFQENVKELQHIIGHFGLSQMRNHESGKTLNEQLVNQFCDSYDARGFAARNSEKNGSGIWHVANDLFCRDGESAEMTLQMIQQRVAESTPAKMPPEQGQSTSPQIIYIAENDHGDMSYGSLIEQIIKDCQAKGLSTKVFSEFPSQTVKAQYQTPRIPELMNLQNSRESVEATAKFLDAQFIQMGDIQKRNSRYDATWQGLPKGMNTRQLVELLEDNVDNPELLKAMKNDLVTGEISGKDNIGNLENFYAYWRNPLHYKQTHEMMVKDVMDNLTTTGTPDMLIIVAGSPHLIGIDQQLTIKSSQKIVVGNHPQGLDPLNNLIFSGTPKICAGIADSIGFEVDLKKKEAVVPAIVKEMIDEKSQSKISVDGLDLFAKEEANQSWTARVGGSVVKKIESQTSEAAKQEKGWKRHLKKDDVDKSVVNAR